ncbi:MAG: hypothetical protein ABI605_11030 [Rhizobacter sp.]
MNTVNIFIASFLVVFALGVQQLNVTADRKAMAFATSLLIGAATLVQFKVLPGPTSTVEIGAYLIGSALGIVASMWAYPLLARLFKRRPAPNTGETLPRPPSESAVKLGERLRLATAIADYSSRADIESFCMTAELDGISWWNTQCVRMDDGIEQAYVDNAVGYLHLRGHLRRHPVKAYLVRFGR